MKSHRGKSAARKPLRDVSNAANALPSRKKSRAKDGADGALDRLLLLRSDLSSLVSQIDELIAQAMENRTISKKASQDIDSFRSILSDMHFSLKPWFSRLRQSFDTSLTATENKLKSLDTNPVPGAVRDRDAAASSRNEPELNLIVSSSPLVSWRAGTCTIDCGRQLFLLTPLPKGKPSVSKCPGSSKHMAGVFTEKEQSGRHKLPPFPVNVGNSCRDLIERVEEKHEPTGLSNAHSFGQMSGALDSGSASPLSLSNQKNRENEITSRLPKSSGMLDPISEPSQQDGVPEDDNDAEVSDSLSMTCQELFGMQAAPVFMSRRKKVDGTLNWFLSPPRTCILLEPSDEKPFPTPANSQLSLATPICKNLDSTHEDKLPGETTLKRELWTRFEAASSNHLHLDVSVFQDTRRKGFLDMLEEVSGKTSEFRF
uniref:Uncharacterized protein n=1 Tax=Musa acuminata subsp. malaccensis TaxID=214687 RepID=A0A804J2I2_MUSAM|nr:PREDICTED: uncharacterized protein LOC103984736 [Musa acuminata subsp. malaccensis]